MHCSQACVFIYARARVVLVDMCLQSVCKRANVCGSGCVRVAFSNIGPCRHNLRMTLLYHGL